MSEAVHCRSDLAAVELSDATEELGRESVNGHALEFAVSCEDAHESALRVHESGGMSEAVHLRSDLAAVEPLDATGKPGRRSVYRHAVESAVFRFLKIKTPQQMCKMSAFQ